MFKEEFENKAKKIYESLGLGGVVFGVRRDLTLENPDSDEKSKKLAELTSRMENVVDFFLVSKRLVADIAFPDQNQ